MTYLCTKCKADRAESLYYFYPSGKRYPYCLICRRSDDRRRDKRPERAAGRERFRKNRREQIQILKTIPCTDCSENHAYFVMDMDHLVDKLYNMSSMLSAGRERIAAEAAKCEAVCANCHRIRTFGQNPERMVSTPKNIKATTRIGYNVRQSQYDENWSPDGPFCGGTKSCHDCSKILPVEWFDKRSDTGRFVSKCRPCAAKYQTKWHINSSLKRKLKIKERHRTETRESREYIRLYKESHLCADCGKKWAPYVLDFDHVRGVKIANVSLMPGRYLLKVIIEEIAKCEVVCARCHRYRTQARRTGVNVNPCLIKSS